LNLKLVGEPLPVEDGELEHVRQALGDRPLLVAASTHAGEEAMALDAFRALELSEPLLVIAPRHPARGAEVTALVRTRGWEAGLRSEGAAFGTTPVYVADTLGELGLWFRLASAAYLGGGHAPGVGGHNPLEPARLHCPLASGPRVENWRGVFDGMNTAEALTFTADVQSLETFWRGACSRDPALTDQAARAADFAARQSGQLDLAVQRLLALLP
jgi:3-deoxy-D-manno-octulosonic-acid transferase